MSDPQGTDGAVFNFMQSATALLDVALDQARRDDQAAFDAISRAMAAGAMLTLKATLVPATGLALLAVELVDLGGHVHNVMSCELQRPAPQ